MFHETHLFSIQLASYIQAHADALQNAAMLLGGRSALRRVRMLLEEFESRPELTARMRRETRALHDLLTLQHVDDLDRDEAGCFAMLSPDSPHVAEICLLADGLEQAMTSAGIEPTWMSDDVQLPQHDPREMRK